MAKKSDFISILFIIFIIIIMPVSAAEASATGKPALYSINTSGFHSIVIYYGWLNTSNLENLSPGIVVVAGSERILPGGPDKGVIDSLLSKGAEIYAYLEDLNGDGNGGSPDGDNTDDIPVGLGSSFKSWVVDNTTGTFNQRVSDWVHYIESLIDNYEGVVTGVFLDECDPSYFTDNVSDPLVSNFTEALKNITTYAHSKGLKVFINGVMGYASLGDWYLWEDFLDTYNETTGEYVLIYDFLKASKYNSSLEWVNGYSRYLYLRDNGLLNKTIAVTFADPVQPETLDWANAAYMLARIMGLAGWGYANYTFYSNGGPVPQGIVEAYETGPAVSNASFSNTSAWRVFMLPGNVTMTLSQAGTSVALNPGWPFPTSRPVVDGANRGEYRNSLSRPIEGSNSYLNYAGVNMTPTGTYLYAEWNYTSQASSGGLLHIYIDSDGNVSTGYQAYGIGADYMIEVYTDGTAHLFNYTGSGSDWSWSDLGAIESEVTNSSLKYTGEFATSRVRLSTNTSKLVFAVVYDWSDDAVSPSITAPAIYVYQPTILEDASLLSNYTGLVSRLDLDESQGKAVILAEGPSGATVNYTIILPFDNIEEVLVNGSSIPQGAGTPPTYTAEQVLGGSYSKVTILVTHHSPVNITILGSTAQPVPEPSLLPVVIAGEALLLAVVFAMRRTSTQTPQR
ncbi:MAG: hypothetical protein F7C33_02275 [Desulfurococcales archaeon]|nr:hypothetical protein [Desulfurococcales archaeon]